MMHAHQREALRTLPPGSLIASSCRAALACAFLSVCGTVAVLVAVDDDSVSLLAVLHVVEEAAVGGGERGPTTPGTTGDGWRGTGEPCADESLVCGSRE